MGRGSSSVLYGGPDQAARRGAKLCVLPRAEGEEYASQTQITPQLLSDICELPQQQLSDYQLKVVHGKLEHYRSQGWSIPCRLSEPQGIAVIDSSGQKRQAAGPEKLVDIELYIVHGIKAQVMGSDPAGQPSLDTGNGYHAPLKVRASSLQLAEELV